MIPNLYLNYKYAISDGLRCFHYVSWMQFVLSIFSGKKMCSYRIIRKINLNLEKKKVYYSSSPDSAYTMLIPVVFCGVFFEGKYTSLKWHRFKIALKLG